MREESLTRLSVALTATCLLFVASCEEPPPADPASTGTSGASGTSETETTPDLVDAYRAPVDQIIAGSAEADYAWQWLRTLCVDIGHRLSGSESLERAVAWAEGELEGIEGARVVLQEVEVPRWVRGEESLVLLGDGEDEALAMIGLGGSVGTPDGGIEAEVVIVDSLEDLDEKADQVAGRIVLIDRAMPHYDEEALETGYGETVPIRTGGPARGAAHGALAVLVRSVTDDPESPPHTGATRYADDGPRIPGAAVSVAVVNQLRAIVEAGDTPRVRLSMEAEDRGMATSHNVIAEIPGSALPEEIVLFGGHIDSWDVGQGCHDDASGVVSAMATLRLLRELDLVPRRTIRAVLFTNEENGLRGAKAYGEERWEDGLHVAGIESDIGAARVIGLQVNTEAVRESVAVGQIEAIAELLASTGVRVARAGFAGADLIPLREKGVPGIGVLHDPAHYFDLHHTAADTFEAVDRDDFLQGVAVMASTAYVVADMEPRLSNPR